VIVVKKPVKVIVTNIDTFASEVINTKNIKAEELASFAETLQGIGYKYGSTDPEIGFDCSGFISYVFNHFDISVPRSSIDFTDISREINLKEAKRGDIILFTGTDSTKRVVGHMGIITSPQGQSHEFIHSTSGKAYSVTKTPLNQYYQGRFVKAIRIFKEEDT
jgi:cell wall-associated NlpC family hydrolase